MSYDALCSMFIKLFKRQDSLAKSLGEPLSLQFLSLLIRDETIFYQIVRPKISPRRLILFPLSRTLALILVPSYSRAFAALLRQLALIDLSKVLSVGVERAVFEAGTDAAEERAENMVVVNLQKDPAEHFFCRKKVLDICSVVRRTGVTGAGL